MIHESHKFGALTELRCAAELIKRDWHVAFPFIDSSVIDLIAYRGNHFVTIQVKSTTLMEGNHAKVTKSFDKYDGVDFIICYDINNRRWFSFPLEELKGRKAVTLSPIKYERNCDNWALIR